MLYHHSIPFFFFFQNKSAIFHGFACARRYSRCKRTQRCRLIYVSHQHLRVTPGLILSLKRKKTISFERMRSKIFAVFARHRIRIGGHNYLKVSSTFRNNRSRARNISLQFQYNIRKGENLSINLLSVKPFLEKSVFSLRNKFSTRFLAIGLT